MRRLPTAVVALLACAALVACGPADDGDGPSVAGKATTTTDAEATAPPSEPTGPSGADAAPPGPTTAPTGGGAGGRAASTTTTSRSAAGGGPATSTQAPSDAPATTSSPAPPVATADDGSQGPPGAFARTLLRPRPATSVVLERAAQSGADVAADSLSHSVAVLREVTGKPVDAPAPLALEGGSRDWSASELRALADRSARTPQGDGRAVVRLLSVRGTYQGSDEVLGVALRGDVIVLFRDNIVGASTPVVSSRRIEDAVLVHEIGHVLGLVDLVLETGRADPEHPGHSRNRDSVMYWAVESSVVAQVLSGGPPRDFDAADLADLRTIRNGG